MKCNYLKDLEASSKQINNLKSVTINQIRQTIHLGHVRRFYLSSNFPNLTVVWRCVLVSQSLIGCLPLRFLIGPTIVSLAVIGERVILGIKGCL